MATSSAGTAAYSPSVAATAAVSLLFFFTALTASSFFKVDLRFPVVNRAFKTANRWYKGT